MLHGIQMEAILSSSMQPLLHRQVCGVSLPSSAVSWLRRPSVHGFLKVLQVDMGLVRGYY